MAEAKKGGWLKAAVVGMLGLGGGAAGTYATAVIDKVVKPTLPVANFAVAADGLTVTCQNHATGETGWWDFGDGSPLEPFAPSVPAVTHAYPKAGTYSVKLVVRNFTADENDRSVAVEVGSGGKGSPAALPQIAAFAVQPLTPAAVAPATFRLTADVKDADSCVWDFGDGRLEVAGGGKIDRLVTFDRPGAFPIQLVAHNATAAAKPLHAV
jgi:PKD repeat protein